CARFACSRRLLLQSPSVAPPSLCPGRPSRISHPPTGTLPAGLPGSASSTGCTPPATSPSGGPPCWPTAAPSLPTGPATPDRNPLPPARADTTQAADLRFLWFFGQREEESC